MAMNGGQAYVEAIKEGRCFEANVIRIWHRNPSTKLKGLVNLLRAGHDVRVAERSIDTLLVDGVITPWAVLEEWARRKASRNRSRLAPAEEVETMNNKRWLACKFTEGPRYIKAYVEDAAPGVKIVVAFFDKRRGRWFAPASWTKPTHRLTPQRIAEGLSLVLNTPR